MIENSQSDGGFLLHHGGHRVPFTVEFRKRAKLAISVHPDMRVKATAPTGSSMDAVLARVEKRAGWIFKQIRFFEQYQPAQPIPRYVSGETHLFLGRQYRLKVGECSAEGVKLIGRFFFVWVKDRHDPRAIQNHLDAWYRDHAERLFTTRLRIAVGSTKALAIKSCPKLLIRRMERAGAVARRQGIFC